MPPASVPTLCTISAVSAALDPEFLRVLRMADPGAALEGALTFAPPAAAAPERWLAAWVEWRDGVLAPVLGPALLAVAAYAAVGKTREIQALNLRLHEALEPKAAVRSALAGGRLLQRLSTSRGERWVRKLHDGAVAGEIPMHLAVVYAAQSALFHLPLRQLLPGYGYWEWTAAHAALPPTGTRRPEFIREAAALGALAKEALASSECHPDHAHAVFGGS
jgi:hypothetical protein